MSGILKEERDSKTNELICTIPKVIQQAPKAPTIVFLTPGPEDSGWQYSFNQHATNFKALGAIVLSIPWSESPISAEPSYIYVANLVWGYHLSADRWITWLRSWPKNIRLINSPDLLLWNTKKTYLKDLEMAGVPVVPTVYVEHVDKSTLLDVAARFNTSDLVVKPQISASSDNTMRVLVGDEDFASRPKSVSAEEAIETFDRVPNAGSLMVQPFMTTIYHQGEISVLVFGGQISHAVRKVVHGSDYRVQTKYGGTYVAIDDLTPEIHSLVNATLLACPEIPTYARIDMLRNDMTGDLCVIELELIEPGFYLDYALDAGMKFAKSILNTIN